MLIKSRPNDGVVVRPSGSSAQQEMVKAAGQAGLSKDQLAEIRSWYRGAVAKGIADNQNRRSKIGKHGLGWPAGSATTRT